MALDSLNRISLRLLVLAYLATAVILGGSSQPGQVSHLLLQTVGALLAIPLIFRTTGQQIGGYLGPLMICGALLLSWILCQTIPLPYNQWSQLQGREVLTDGWKILGTSFPDHFPISFAPDETRTALLGYAPPFTLAVLILATSSRSINEWLLWAIIVLAGVSASLGIAQITATSEHTLYWHKIGSPGYITGFFANANHQATLCLMAIPLIIAMGGKIWHRRYEKEHTAGLGAFLAFLFALCLIGVIGTGSIAGYLILAPVLLFSVPIFIGGRRPGQPENAFLIGGAVASLSVIISAVAFSPILDDLLRSSISDSPLSRPEVWRVSGEMAKDHFLFGTGAGTFTETFRLYEEDSQIYGVFVNFAHNDYLQVIVELGLPGVILIVAAILIWATAVINVWRDRSDRDYRLRRGASVSLMVPILHSFVDYPLRTPAVACVAVACLFIMAYNPSRGITAKPANGAQRPGHVTL